MNKDLFLISGASTGIGRALTEHFAAQGHRVLAGVRSQKDVETLATSENIKPFILDVAKSQDIEKIPALIEANISNFRKLVLINNAGIAISGPWEIIEESDLRNQLEVNFFGAVFLTQKCLPYLRKTHGHIFNISSIAGIFATPFMGPYAVSKHAMEAFSDSLRRELSRFKVSVTSINPGPIKTPIWQKGLSDPKGDDLQNHPVYGSLLKRFGKNVAKVASKAIDVRYVVAAVEKAHKDSSPPTRVLVSDFGTKSVIRMTRWLPDKLVDNLVKRL